MPKKSRDMLLSPDEADLFFKLYHGLMFHANQTLEVVPDFEKPEDFFDFPPKTRLEFRKALLEQPNLIESFIEDNPAEFSEEELQIVRSWQQHRVSGRFFAFRQLKKSMIFLPVGEEAIAYGVVALTEPFENLIGPSLPVMVETVLLPFRDKIIYDGTIGSFNVTFGGGVKRRLNDDYREAKERMGGVVTSLPAEAHPAPKPKAKKPPKRKSARSASQVVKPVLESIIAMTDEFCRENLNEEYAELCRKLAEKLSRKRPSPLLRRRPTTWASGIVRTIGWVNFLHDPSQTPHLRLYDIDDWFGISESTGAAKLKEIRKMLRIHQFDFDWTLPSQMEENPLVWMLEINGFVMDVRNAPRKVQEIAFQKGLIPYIPGDQ